MGMVLYEQHRLEEVVYDSMRSSTKIEETIKKNEPTSKITITTIDSTLHVKVEKTLDSIFGKVVGLKSYHLTIQYKLNQGKISKE